MKKIVFTLAILLLPLMAAAQSASLQVSRVFSGDVVPVDRMVLTRVRGRQLSQYGLSFYRSARFEATPDEAARVERMVKADGKQYGQSEQATEGGGTSIYICDLRTDGRTHRYLCLKSHKKGKRLRAMTVVYMEGTVGSIAELNKLINK